MIDKKKVYLLKKINMKKIIFLFLLLFFVTSCSEASVVSENISNSADYFEINRRVIFYNWITWDYILTIQGLCSINHNSDQLEVTCKVWDNIYKKHFLWLSDNVTYFVEQIEPDMTNRFKYKVIFKPSTIIPDIQIK